MPRVIILDTFPLSSTGKREPFPGATLTLTEQCNLWIRNCVAAGNQIFVPSICYYEAIREMERLNATSQIARIRGFCFAVPDRFISITDAHLEQAARLWAQSRNRGLATASPDALDGDVILSAQAQSLGFDASAYIVATTNVGHLVQFVPADHWQNIIP